MMPAEDTDNNYKYVQYRDIFRRICVCLLL